MFHRAPPDCDGSGVRIWRPGCVRSFQLWMFFGFPGRTEKTTAPAWPIGPSRLCPVVSDEVAVLNELHVGCRRRGVDVRRGAVDDVLGLRRAPAEQHPEDRLLVAVRLLPVGREGQGQLAVGVIRVAVRSERDDGRVARSAVAAGRGRGVGRIGPAATTCCGDDDDERRDGCTEHYANLFHWLSPWAIVDKISKQYLQCRTKTLGKMTSACQTQTVEPHVGVAAN